MNKHIQQKLAAIKAGRLNHDFNEATGSYSLADVRGVIRQLEASDAALTLAVEALERLRGMCSIDDYETGWAADIVYEALAEIAKLKEVK